MSKARDLLARPTFTRWAVVVAALLSSPALLHGFEVDDRLQRQAALGRAKLFGHGAFDLFTFLDGDPKHTLSLLEHGLGAWWSDLHARIAFFRPLSSLLLYFDYRVLGHPVLVHAHSIAWYAAMVALTGLLFRALIDEPWVAGLATLLFSIDHSHGLLASWIAQRNAVLAGVFGIGALLLHHRGRRGLAAVSLGLGLASGEAVLGVLPYLLAYAWFLDGRRWRTLVPYAAPLVLWAALYVHGGYGARGSGLYVDPLRQPVAFLGNVLTHGPILFATELGMPAADLYPFVPLPAKVAIVLLSAAMIAAFAWAIAPFFRRDPVTRFFVVGAALSVLPTCAVFPSGRLTLLTSVGVLGALAQLLAAFFDRTWRPRGAAVPVVYWSGLGHLFLSPWAFVLSMHQMTLVERIITRNADGVPNVPELATQRLVVPNAPDATFLAYLGIIRAERGDFAPDRVLAMAAGTKPLELLRDDERTLTLSSPVGFVQPGTDLLARADVPFAVGYRVVFSDVTIEITRVDGRGSPTAARFTFVRPLEDRSLRFMQWKDQTLQPMTLPAIGQRLSFAAQLPQLL